MKRAGLHPRELERLGEVLGSHLLDTAPTPELDALVHLAGELLECPMALIGLIDERREWFKSKRGLEGTEAPRELTFCAHSILQDQPLVVEDALLDERFADNPFVTDAPHVRFYAGVPLRMGPRRLPIGAMCVIDSRPRRVFDAQLATLVTLARQAERLMELDATVHQQRRMLRRLEEVEEHERAMLDAMRDGAVLILSDGSVSWHNRAAERLMGLSEEELVGRAPHPDGWSMVWADGTEVARDERPARKVLKTGAPMRDVVVGVGPAHARRWLLVNAEPLFHAGETEPWAAFTHFGDATHLQALRHERDEATTQSRARSDLLANMSHEIRTPLNGVLGMAQLVLTGPLDEVQRERVETLRDSGASLLTLLNDVLDLSKLEAGQRTLASEPTDVVPIARSVTQLLGTVAAKKGLTLQLEPSLPSAVALADADAVRQVLLNLVGNALKFTQAGGVTVKLGREGSALTLAVHDTGIGISPDELPRLFHRFAQADASTARRFGGTGLGLAISRRLVQGMGGEVEVESTPGRGSVFRVRLTASDLAPQAREESARPQAPLPRLSILLAEDNVVNQRVAMGLLAHLGQSVQLARNGREALELLARERFDLVLMDLHMPELDGLDATRALRLQEGDGPRLPVYALTASVLEAEQAACLAAGMNAVISKPVTIAALERAVRAHAVAQRQVA